MENFQRSFSFATKITFFLQAGFIPGAISGSIFIARSITRSNTRSATRNVTGAYLGTFPRSFFEHHFWFLEKTFLNSILLQTSRITHKDHFQEHIR